MSVKIIATLIIKRFLSEVEGDVGHISEDLKHYMIRLIEKVMKDSKQEAYEECLKIARKSNKALWKEKGLTSSTGARIEAEIDKLYRGDK